MAEYTIVDNTGNGGRITYIVTGGGYISINVVGPGIGQNLAVGQGNQYNSAVALTDAIGDLNVTINRQNNYINSYKAKITDLNSKLNDPNLDPTLREQYKKEISDYQDSIKNSQANILTAQQAITSLNTIGGSTLQSLIDQAKEANTEAQTAKPVSTAPTANGASTTTTTGGGTATTTTISTSKGSTVNGVASDDSGATQANPAGSTGGPKASPAAASGTGGTTPSTAKSTATGAATKTGTAPSGTNTASNAGTGQGKETNATSGAYKFQSSIISNQPVATASQPGKRLFNPLGEFSSYTYQISLYMITPDAYEAFVLSGRTKINVLNETASNSGGGAYLIAQSGGVNKGSEQRAPGFDFDYGIDNLIIKSKVNPKSTGAATNIYEVSFNIMEPYGFSFISNLRKASDALEKYSKNLQKGNTSNPSRQMFVLGFRFLGYDASGRPMKPNTKLADGSGVVDPLSETGTIFEHFIDLNIYSLKFKIDGRMVTYAIKANSPSSSKGYSVSRGVLKSDHNVTANTVGVALDQLLTQINEEQQKMSAGKPPSLTYPNKYEIVWLPGTEEIWQASIISKARFEKLHWPGSGAQTPAASNAGRETVSQGANENYKQLTFHNGQPILQVINDTIKLSSYLEEALNVVYTSAPESDPTTKSQPKINPTYQKKKVSWFSCHPQITDIKWDPMVNDWSYKISYLIQKYDTPIVDSPVVQNGKLYPGPHKRYDYWYTGENRDIIQYEQVMDNSYFVTVVSAGDTNAASDSGNAGAAPASSNNASGAGGNSNTQTPRQPGMQTNQPRQGSTGYGLEAQNNYLTALYDPSAYAVAKITIMGDPDLLSSDPVYSEEQIYDQFYGSNGFSINANGGQVYVEIDFKEAIDYTSQTGTMKINESILFWQYPDEISKKIKGVSYMVTDIVSTFNNGTFRQVLTCNINDFGDKEKGGPQSQAGKAGQTLAEAAQREEQNAQNQEQGQNPGDSNTQSAQTPGTTQDQPTTASNNGNTAPTTQTAAPQAVDPKTGVATDNNTSTNKTSQVQNQGRPG